jgi:sugar O-acyltransferase (sialic acid O-acetyltransferase NeuD family)
MKRLAIVGSGDLGQQIAYYALSDGHYDDVIFFDDFNPSGLINNCRVVGTTADVEQAYKANAFDELMIGIGYKYLDVRKQLYQKFSASVPFGKVLHSTSWIDRSAEVQAGCVIYPGCFIDAKVKIKANTVINIACTIAHDTVIGSHSFLSPRVAIAGFVEVNELCIIGINSTIIDNIVITDKVQLGGGTVVIKAIQQSGLYVGNPAKFIR